VSGYFADHWYGRLTADKAFWKSSTVGFFISLPFILPAYGLWAMNSHIDLSNLGESLLQGQLKQEPFYAWLLQEIAGDVLFIWWAVGTWRSCERVAVESEGKQSHWGMKAIILGAVLWVIFDSTSSLMEYCSFCHASSSASALSLFQ
jgi:hypothetical protein